MTAIDLRDSVEALSSSASPSFLAVYRSGGDGGRPALELLGESPTASLSTEGPLTVVFAGELFDRDKLVPGTAADGDAGLVLAAFRRYGDEALKRIRGVFALAVHDARKETLLFARDQLGHQPFFYSQGHDGLYVSESITRLLAEPGVPTDVHRAVVAELLMHRTRSIDETGFEAVRRVRAGWAYRLAGSRLQVSRYWFPVDPTEETEWARQDELEQFEGLMEQAVARAVEPGATSIFLSGGLDSVTVATYAADFLLRVGKPPPIALSLVFPEFDETEVQRIVAGTLELPHELIPYDEAAGSESLVMSAVRTSGTWPMPLVNLWQPLYTQLALRARETGARRILTGAGGDEWLQVSPQWGFSRLRRLRVREMHHLYRTYLQSYNLRPRPLLKNLLWKYGLHYTIRGLAVKGFETLAPGTGSAWKRRRFQEIRPAWIAPDPDLSETVDLRAGALRPIETPGVTFAKEYLPYLDNPIGAMEREEAFERGRRLGTETYMPFWDADLDAFLARVPPHLMNQGYWSKGLVRGKLAARFPEAGFDRQRKILSTTLSTRLMVEQIPAVWRAIGGTQALAASGIVDEKALQSDVERRLRIIERPHDDGRQILEQSIAAHGIWTVLNVETWLRQWT
jgi:asparagine synthase (glutamine-hydrolysing)